MQLLQHFKELTVNPKNAEELKGLILQLAIQGKLTKKWREQHPNVEPAAVLLERIKAEKAQLIKDKKIRKEKPLPEIEEDEIPYELPEGWNWTRLGTYIHNFGQKKPNIEFNYIDVASIDNDKGIIKNNLALIQPNEAPSRARKIIQKGCVIYSTVRPYLLNIAVVDRDFKNEAIASTAFAVLNPLQGCSEIYLYHILRSYLFIEYVESCMKGVAYPAINDSNLLRGIIPIPPLEEQKAIVKIVNQLFTEVEALEEQTKAQVQLKEDFVTSALQQLTTGNTQKEWAFLQDHFKTFFTEKTGVKKLRESILQLAVKGKLTQHWRNENPLQETAAVLLEKIKAEKAQLIKEKKIRKEKALPPITEDEIPYELPEGWSWCRLGEFTTIKGGKRLPKGEKLTTDDTGLIYIRVTDMKNGTIDDSDLHYISREVHSQISQYIITQNDIYLTIVGATIGKLGLVPERFDGMNLTENAARIIMYQVSKYYLYRLMLSKFVQGQFFNKTNQVGVPKLALHRVAKTLIPLPPLEEQKAIVSKVNALMGLCDRLEQEIAYSTTQVEQLMQSCLKEVFVTNNKN